VQDSSISSSFFSFHVVFFIRPSLTGLSSIRYMYMVLSVCF